MQTSTRQLACAFLTLLIATGCDLPLYSSKTFHEAKFTLSPDTVFPAGRPVVVDVVVAQQFRRHDSCSGPACDPVIVQSVLAVGCAQSACAVDEVRVDQRLVSVTLHATADVDTTLEASLVLSDGTARQASAPVRFRTPARLVVACDTANAGQCGGPFAVLAGTDLAWTVTALSADYLTIPEQATVEIEGDALALAGPGRSATLSSTTPTVVFSAVRPGVGRVHLRKAGLDRWQTVTVEDPEQATALEVWNWAHEVGVDIAFLLDIDAVPRGVSTVGVTASPSTPRLALALHFPDGMVALGGAGLLHVTGLRADVAPTASLGWRNENLALGAFTVHALAQGDGLLEADLGSAHLRLPLHGVP